MVSSHALLSFAQPATNKIVKQIKIGIFTGTFDPPHLDHKDIAEGMKKKFNLDIVYVVPKKSTRYKPNMLPHHHRKKMVEIMFSDSSNIKTLPVSLEKKVVGDEIWDIANAVQTKHHRANIYPIMGTDAFELYRQHPNHHIKNVTILVNRRDRSLKLPTQINDHPVHLVDVRLKNSNLAISSTSIRNNVKAGKTHHKELPASVSSYITDNGLYKKRTTAVSPERIKTKRTCLINVLKPFIK